MSEAYLHGDNLPVYLAEVDHTLEWVDHTDNRFEVGTMVGSVVDIRDNDCVVVDNCHDIGIEEEDLVGDSGLVVVVLGPAAVPIEDLGVAGSIQHLTQLMVADLQIEVLY